MYREPDDYKRDEDWRLLGDNQEDESIIRENKIKKVIIAVLLIFLVVYLAYVYYAFFLKDKIVIERKRAETTKEVVTKEVVTEEIVAKEEIIVEETTKNEIIQDEITQEKETDEIVYDEGYEFLGAIEPTNDNRLIMEYDPEDVKTLNHNCSGNHLHQTVEEFEQHLMETMPKVKMSEGTSLPHNNYYISGNTSYQKLVFETYYWVENLDEYDKQYSGDTSIDMQADTSTGQLHSVGFNFETDIENYKILSDWLNTDTPGVFTPESIGEDVKNAQKVPRGEMYYKCQGNFVIAYYVPDNYAMICVYPLEHRAYLEQYYEIHE